MCRLQTASRGGDVHGNHIMAERDMSEATTRTDQYFTAIKTQTQRQLESAKPEPNP